MMLVLFGQQGHPGHECECLAEILELKLAVEFVIGLGPVHDVCWMLNVEC
jgi:hypothetical protein